MKTFPMLFKGFSSPSFCCLMSLLFLRIAVVQEVVPIVDYFLGEKSRQDRLTLQKYTCVSTQLP